MSGGDLCSDASVLDWTKYPRAAAVTVSGVALTVDARNQEISALSVSQAEGFGSPIYDQMKLTRLRLPAPSKPLIPSSH